MRSFLRSLALLLTLLAGPAVLAQPAAAPAEPQYSIKEHYTKYEYRIPMRDGKRLFTSVLIPKDQSRSYPLLMTRTPYSVAPYGVDEYPQYIGASMELVKAGYIFVAQDVRGRNLSEGSFIEMTPHRPVKGPRDVDESTDMHDSVEWLLKNLPNHNGRVGIHGISYPGFYAAASIIDGHPAIKAASPQAPIIDLYRGDDAYHNGAFMLAANFGFYGFFKPQREPAPPPKVFVPYDFKTQDGYDFFLRAGNLRSMAAMLSAGQPTLFEDQIAHDTFDAYWQARDLAPHLKNIRAAVLTVGGWFDAEDLQGPLRAYREIGRNNPGIFNALVMGPWAHGGWGRHDGMKFGHLDFGAKTSEHFRKNIELPFFEKFLKDKADVKLAQAHVFETGTNVWRQYASWPPASAVARTLYFQPGQGLHWSQGGAASGFDEYLSDPARPVPFTESIATDVPQEYMAGDQRFAASRPDVLVYQSEVLEEDLTIAGPVTPRLFVSTSGSDSDFVVKLIDVFPADLGAGNTGRRRRDPEIRDVTVPAKVMAGYQMLVRGEPFRARFRKGFATPVAMTPNQVEPIEFSMPDVHHTFRRGHRIMVQVQSSWFPLVDRNPQTFVKIADARPQDFVRATQRVYRSGQTASSVQLLVMPASP